MIRRLLAATALASLLAAPAFAWGQTGHRVTGAIAERYLSDQAREGVRALLGPETLAEASSWADFMRASDEPFWREAGPYHYVTVPHGHAYHEVGAPDEGDAVSALAMFAQIVRDERAPLEERQRALRFIVHIVGDLHQPLHAGNGTDRGGNDVRVSWFGEETNLHSVWDSQMINGWQLSFSEIAGWLGARITQQQAAEWMQADPQVWIAESTAIRDTVYPGEERLGYDYAFAHKATVDRRLSMGGVRIAAYLNGVFSEAMPAGETEAGARSTR